MMSIRCVFLTAVVLASASYLAPAQENAPVRQARADATPASLIAVDIPAQPMEKALQAFSTQSGFQMIFPTEFTQALSSPELKGHYTPEVALSKLLANSSLRYAYVNPRTIAILSTSSLTQYPNSSRGQSSSVAGQSESSDPVTIKEADRKKSFGERFQVAQAAQGSAPGPVPVGKSASSAEQSTVLQEIVVTAQKRSEKLLDVPSAIGVLTGAQLESQKIGSLSDLAGFVPGVSIASLGQPGYQQIVIRGIATSYTQAFGPPTVATYVDDTPVGSSTNGARAAILGLDLLPYDLDRIEVLEGPQGTLYGADAMGGVVKYVLKKPDLVNFDARTGTYVEDIDGGGVGWGVRGAANIPLIADTVALRVSAYRQDNAGWIDNLGTGRNDSNSSIQEGGRVALLWKPASWLCVQGSWLAQNNDSNDLTQSTQAAPNVQFSYFPNTLDQRTRLGSLDISADLTFATLTSASSWSQLNSAWVYDISLTFAPYTPGYPNALSYDALADHDSKFTEEIRLASAGHQRLQWILGTYFTRENFGETNNAPSFTASYVPLPPADNLLISDETGVYKEWAVFANATLKLSDRFDLGAGLRYASNIQAGCVLQSAGVFGAGASPCTSRPYQGKTTWMTDGRFHLNDETMIYARIATGYRPGGGCSTCGNPTLGTPNVYYPDTVTNYELGLKTQTSDRRLSLNADVFYINWTDIQIAQLSPKGAPYTGNGGTAISEGVELATIAAVSANLQLQAVLDFTNAHLTEDAPGAGGRDGDQLPASARWSGSLGAEYKRPMSGQVSLSLAADYRYRDQIYNQFPSSSEPFLMGPQNLVNLRAGFDVKGLSARAYVKNLFDNQSFNGYSTLTRSGEAYVPVQPRTVGISVDYQF